ncbi:class I fructose-bisphosphate aldolase [Synechococcus sp. M16CYN]
MIATAQSLVESRKRILIVDEFTKTIGQGLGPINVGNIEANRLA